MYRFASMFFILIFMISSCVPTQSSFVSVPEPDYWPTIGWQSATPETQGMNSDLLAEMVEDINHSQTNIYSALVIRHGYIVTEAYFHPYTRDTKVHVQSITKSVIGMLVGRAIATGAIKNEDEPLLSFFPGRVISNPGKEKESIRLSHLLSMTSGLDCQEFSASSAKMEQSSGWVQFMLDLPVVSSPGEKFNYCNGSAHLLSAILEKTTGVNTRIFANQELFGPLGIPAVEESDWGSDPQGFTIGGYGLHLRPIDLAKLALLSLQGGKWEGKQLFPVGWTAKSVSQWVQKEEDSASSRQSGYGYLWTVYPKENHYAALGLGGQQIHVFPAKDLIVIIAAGLPAYAEAPEIEKMLNQYILPSMKSDTTMAENGAGMARLGSAVKMAANPVQPVSVLPATALDVSGSVYTFSENPFAWQSLRFVFTAGASSAQLYFNEDTMLNIGLDNLFRPSDSPILGRLLLRGGWEDEKTFVVDYPYAMAGPNRLGELGETEMRFQFDGDRLIVTNKPLIFGGDPIILHGER